jgi:hypothetical protein
MKGTIMRSILYEHYGEPGYVLRLCDVPDLPAPTSGEVLIRVHSRPVHPGDLLGIRGRYRSPGNTVDVAPGGARPGFEGSGVIEGCRTERGCIHRTDTRQACRILSREGGLERLCARPGEIRDASS